MTEWKNDQPTQAAKERVLVEYRGNLMVQLKSSVRPWHPPHVLTPVLPTQIPYLWRTSIPYKWPVITSRPVQQVMGLYRDKRDTMEFIIEKQKLIHQISNSPLRKLREAAALREKGRRHTSTCKEDSSMDYSRFNVFASHRRATTSSMRPLTRSSSLQTASYHKVPFEFSAGGKRTNPSLKRDSSHEHSAPRLRAPSSGGDTSSSPTSTSKPLDFLITKYSLPAALVSVSEKFSRVKGSSSSLTNKEIESYLHRFQQTSSVPREIVTSRTGFSGFKLTLKKPAEKKQSTTKVKRVNAVAQASGPPSPPIHLGGELYLQYLKYKKECRSRALSSIC